MFCKMHSITRHLMSVMPPEKVHRFLLYMLKSGLLSSRGIKDDPALEVILWEKKFPNPVGLAAGFDRNAEVLTRVLSLGFGFAEAGTVTPRPQQGNPEPRFFCDPESCSFINRMGFPNQGGAVFKKNFERTLDCKPRPSGLFGINIGMNRNCKNPERDYCRLIRLFGPMADYFTINVSFPHVRSLSGLQNRENLLPLLNAVIEEREKSCGSSALPPLLVKLSPDLDENKIEEIAQTVIEAGIDGLIISNSSLKRPDFLPSSFSAQSGGLSGKAIGDQSTEVVRSMYKFTGGSIPIIGLGGVFTGEDAYEKIKAGASLVQIYSAMFFRGPLVAGLICRELKECLKNDGFNNVREAVGIDAG